MADLDRLEALEGDAGDLRLQDEWRRVKAANKARLADLVAERTDLTVNPETMFGVTVKRLHEYKRQLLNVLHVVTLYQRLQADPAAPFVPRTVVIGGKAAPGSRSRRGAAAAIRRPSPLRGGRPRARTWPRRGAPPAR
jgi:glycogen phosphorylase